MNMPKICAGCRDGTNFELPFKMAFQPIVDTSTGRAFAYERWSAAWTARERFDPVSDYG